MQTLFLVLALFLLLNLGAGMWRATSRIAWSRRIPVGSPVRESRSMATGEP